MKSESFTAADVDFPAKLIANKGITDMVQDGKLLPFHLQLNPTNRCNLNCEFCSCRDRNKNAEIPLEKVQSFCATFPSIKAVTITGGGEPLLYRDFDALTEYFYACGIQMGMVTNGYLLPDTYDTTLARLTWCRISLSVESGDKLMSAVQYAISDIPVDWAFSFVCSADAQKNAKVISSFYESFEEKITHMRVVGNILEPDDRVAKTRAIIGDPAKIIWQGRSNPSKGAKECRIAMIKPVLDADGRLYPCCGSQYYKRGVDRKLHDAVCMGDTASLGIFEKGHFNGSVCDVCFYGGYNSILGKMMSDYQHIDFV